MSDHDQLSPTDQLAEARSLIEAHTPRHNCLVCAIAALLTRQRMGEGVHMDNSDLTTAADMDVAMRFVTDYREPCKTCQGEGCEAGCGRCHYASVGPESHRVCRTCGGSGLTNVSVTCDCGLFH